jgi:hypothetical protein
VLSTKFFDRFDEAADREARRIESDLQLWEVQLKQRKENPTSRNVVNITGNNNLVQAGTVGSTASLVVDTDSRDALLLAPATLREVLPGAHELGSTQKTELGQVIDDCEREIKEAAPNRSRLAGSLQAIAGAVQTTASLQPAWEAIRRALQLMGLGL